MKNRIFILPLCVLTASVMTANDGLYFPEGSKWTNASSGASYNIQGDTLVDGKMYHKVISINKDGQKLVALKKEEGKKIYVRCEGTDTDVLLYNFGLEVGDSITQHTDDFGFSWCQGPCTYHVERIDTVTLLDGRKAKCIFYDGRMWDIEFVGCETGFFGPITMPEIPTMSSGDLENYSYCFSINGKPIYETYPGICKNCVFLNLPFAQATTWYGVIKHDNPYTGTSYQSVKYYLQGDTIINDTMYHAFRRNNGEYCAGIRQSDDGRQVFIRPTNKLVQDGYWIEGDCLLYDFGAQEGDTIYAFDGSYFGIDNMGEDLSIQYRWVVQDVQTIANRKHIVVKGGQCHDHLVEWIEGVGTKYVLFENNYSDVFSGMYSEYTLCAADSEGNILYSFDTDYLGIHNDCPNWEPMDVGNIQAEPVSAAKVLRGTQILIERGEKTYTPTGQEVR